MNDNADAQPHIILEVPTVRFESEAALAEYLLSAGEPSGTFLYRGQSRDYRRRWPLFGGPFRSLSPGDLIDVQLWRFEPPSTRLPIPLLLGTMDLPSLIPTNTRTYERFLAGAFEGAEENAFEDTMVYFWTTVCLFIAGLASLLQKDKAALAWLRDQWAQDYPRLYKLRSIGQHYGMDTGLLDATSSIPVALWFATHEFHTGAYREQDSAVIYRIRRDRLDDAQRWLEEIPEHEGEFDTGCIDIRDTPKSIAPRPASQQGWSLVGWDHPRMVIKMAATGGLTRYVFPTVNSPSRVNSLTRAEIVPSPDPVAALFEVFWSRQPKSLAQAQQWIDQFWNVATSERIEIAGDGLWMDQVSSEIGCLFDYHISLLRADR